MQSYKVTTINKRKSKWICQNYCRTLIRLPCAASPSSQSPKVRLPADEYVTFPFKFNNRWLHVGQEQVLPLDRATDWTASCMTGSSCSLSSPLCYRVNSGGDSRLIRKMLSNQWFSGIPAISMRQSHSWKPDSHSSVHSSVHEVPHISWKLKFTAYHRFLPWPTWI